MKSRRRTILGAILATATLLSVAPGPATAFDPNAIDISLTPIVSGLSSPVLVTHAGDGSDRLFIVEQGGYIRILSGGTLRPQPFADLHASISTGSERGLLGLAFHPKFETNRLFYVYFTTRSGDLAVSELRASATNPNVRDPGWGRRLLTIHHPRSNHNGGHIAFGPGNYLYIGTGDGGGVGDPDNNAQNLNSLLGKMLRIDVNGRSGSLAYRIPPLNPYVGKPGRDEIYSRGLRNPWRWSFDRSTRSLFIGDVGQNRYEEIDRATTASWWGKGANYGWRVMEGNACYKPSSGCSTSGKVRPILVYGHGSGDCSVSGGHVYRGAMWPALAGGYFYGDFCSGRIWAFDSAARSPVTGVQLLDTSLNISSFGEDEDGEVYVVDLGGAIYRIDAT
ncbi:MAG TPA: PQQ-dependent sugar dehydrogenase [Candidatus Limnocylindrales bacterium]|nr:PQQ-dependent sugar dehydrogenase [Candidatus Limnocylindrales bacterium]